jgi:hypothetical protein
MSHNLCTSCFTGHGAQLLLSETRHCTAQESAAISAAVCSHLSHSIGCIDLRTRGSCCATETVHASLSRVDPMNALYRPQWSAYFTALDECISKQFRFKTQRFLSCENIGLRTNVWLHFFTQEAFGCSEDNDAVALEILIIHLGKVIQVLLHMTSSFIMYIQIACTYILIRVPWVENLKAVVHCRIVVQPLTAPCLERRRELYLRTSAAKKRSSRIT